MDAVAVDPKLDPKNWLEIKNPSDQCHMLGTNRAAAAVACMLLSPWYGLTDSEGESVCPITAIGGQTEFLESLGISNALEWVKDHANEIADVLETVTYGSREECVSQSLALSLIDDPDKRAEFIKSNEDSRRTSMSQIVLVAHELARDIRTMQTPPEAA